MKEEDNQVVELKFTPQIFFSKEEQSLFKQSKYLFLPKEFWKTWEQIDSGNGGYNVPTYISKCPHCFHLNLGSTTGIWIGNFKCEKCGEYYGLSNEEINASL